MTNEEVIQKLNEMKDILMERGWGQVELEDDDGRVCLLGARNIAMYGESLMGEDDRGYCRDEISAAISPVLDFTSIYGTWIAPRLRVYSQSEMAGEVYLWNDFVPMSVNDVIAIIDDAIIRQKELA